MNESNRQETIEELRRELVSGDMRRYRNYYESFREGYFNFARRYSDDEEFIADSYHDAFIAFYENVVEGKITELRSSVKTYVYSIAKYTLFAKLRKRGREVPNDEIGSDVVFEPISFEDAERAEELGQAMSRLSDGCRRILVLFYYRRYTIEAIMHTMNYKNENTAKANKSRCLKKLREIMKGNV